MPTWFKDHGIPVLNWPANSSDLKPIENLWGIVKRKMGGMGFSLVVSYNHQHFKKETFEYISLCVMNEYNIDFLNGISEINKLFDDILII